MRHRVAHRKLGRVTEHRIALLRNQATALLRHERIQTTVPKARELRPFVERLITIAKRGLANANGASGATGELSAKEARVKALHAKRLVAQDVADTKVVTKLFDTIAPRFEARKGGYTRLLRVGVRRGDAAEIAQVELVGSEYNPALDKPADEAPAPAKATGVRGRLQAAASRLRGGKKADTPADEASEADAPKKAAPRKRTATKKTKDE
jgi:large subunit ribosomal protein L17